MPVLFKLLGLKGTKGKGKHENFSRYLIMFNLEKMTFA